MNCNYKVKIQDIQTKYKFKVFCTGYDDSEIKDKIDTMYEAWPKASGEGESVTLDNTVRGTMAIDLKGNTSQDGTPTPSDPVDVSVVSGDNTIKIGGTNIYDYTQYPTSQTYRGVTITNNGDGTITLNGTCTTDGTSIGILGSTEVIQNLCYNENVTHTAYYVSGSVTKVSTSATRCVIRLNYNVSESMIPLEQLTSSNKIISKTQPQRTQSVGWDWTIISGQGDTFNNFTIKYQLEEGSSATEYNKLKTYPINLGTMELCKIGDYQDYIYKENKKWYKYGAIGKVVLDGTEDWALNNSGTSNWYYELRYTANFPTTNTGASNYYQCGKNIANNNTNEGLGFTIGSTQWFIRIRYGTENTVVNFKTWLSTHNTTVYYVLATPTTTEITDATLISQLNALAGAESYSGQTNISQVNNDKPFIITAKALMDLSNLGTNTVSTLNTASVNRLQTPSISPSLNLNNLELNNSEEIIEETPEEE